MSPPPKLHSYKSESIINRSLHVSKCWGKKPKATTKVTLTSHQKVAKSISDLYHFTLFLEGINYNVMNNIILEVCRKISNSSEWQCFVNLSFRKNVHGNVSKSQSKWTHRPDACSEFFFFMDLQFLENVKGHFRVCKPSSQPKTLSISCRYWVLLLSIST